MCRRDSDVTAALAMRRAGADPKAIDAEFWAHFDSAEAVNDALRRFVAEGKKAAGS
jgi:hypothetical protein